MWRHLLAETLVDLAESFQAKKLTDQELIVTSLYVDVPIEVRLHRVDGLYELFADVPLWRWQSGFPEHMGQLKICWEKEKPL